MASYYQLIRHNGIQPLFRAVEMSIASLCNDHPFHIHAEGLRGTGKTSVLRAARQILPPISRIKGCIYNCRPEAPHCPLHRHLPPDQIKALGIEVVPRPFLEISQSAKVGSIVGSIDLGRLTDPHNPSAALLPGTIPLAHRGIIFIDEINRLADTAPEIADVLLDVMGTKPGRIQIEEPGIPTVELAVTVSVWAASNPDEEPGPLSQIRRQLSDRFDFVVPVSQPNDCGSVFYILKNRGKECASRNHAQKHVAVGNMADVFISDDIRTILATIYVDFRLESLRAVEALETAAILEALHDGSYAVTLGHIAGVVPLALGHRIDAGKVAQIVKYLQELMHDLDADNGRISQASTANALAKVSKSKPSNKWIQWFSNLFFQMPASNMTASDHSETQQSQTQKNAGTGSLLRTADMAMTAPPTPALPLSQIPNDQLVTSGGGKKHG